MNQVLQKKVICCSGYDEVSKGNIKELVKKLGGIFSMNLTVKVNLLITNKIQLSRGIELNETKYFV